MKKINVLTIIPAKMDSKRLVGKNSLDLNGKPMFIHSVEYANKSKHDVDVIVSSESEIVKNICEKYDVNFIKRSVDLCGDVEVVDVYLDAIRKIEKIYDYVVCLQPDNPDRSNTFDDCIEYIVENNYDDLITVNKNYKRSGSVRIFKYEHLKKGFVSKRMGCIKDSATDIHYIEELDNIRSKDIFKG